MSRSGAENMQPYARACGGVFPGLSVAGHSGTKTHSGNIIREFPLLNHMSSAPSNIPTSPTNFKEIREKLMRENVHTYPRRVLCVYFVLCNADKRRVDRMGRMRYGLRRVKTSFDAAISAQSLRAGSYPSRLWVFLWVFFALRKISH